MVKASIERIARVYILVISYTPFFPAMAGNRARIAEFIRMLTVDGHDVNFLLLNREGATAEDIAEMRKHCRSVICGDHARDNEIPPVGYSNNIDDWYRPEDDKLVVETLERFGPPDIVVVQYIFLSAAFAHFSGSTLKVLDIHDILAGRNEMLAAIGVRSRFFSTSTAQEDVAFRRSDIVIAIHESDRRKIRARVGTTALSLGYWPSGECTRGAKIDQGGLRIVWFGSSNPLNVRSLQAFIDLVDTSALKAAGAELLLGGEAAGQLSVSDSAIRLVGPVCDSSAFLRSAHLFVNPHIGGTGLKIKTVDALAAGLSVIGTADAFEGLPAVERWHLAEDAGVCAGFVKRWCQDAEFRVLVEISSRELSRRYRSVQSEQKAAVLQAFRDRQVACRPTVLFITDVPFWLEAVGNQVRIAALIRAQSKYALVHVLVVPGSFDLAAQEFVWDEGKALVFIAGAHTSKVLTVSDQRWTDFERRSYQPIAFEAVSAHLRGRSYDAVIIEYVRLSYLLAVSGLPNIVVLDSHDLMSLRALNFAHFDKIHHIDISPREEVAILQKFSVVLTIQPTEDSIVDAWLGGRSICIPYVSPAIVRRKDCSKSRRVAFLGANSPMNREGLRWFLAQVWPAVRRDSHLVIAGSVCEELVRDDDLCDRVSLLHNVPSVGDFLSEVDVAVNPVFYGGGLKIKSIDYLSHGLATVLTPEASYGMPPPAQLCWLTPRSRDEFVGMVDFLLNNEHYRRQLGERARTYAKHYFGEDVSDRAICTLTSLFHPESVFGR